MSSDPILPPDSQPDPAVPPQALPPMTGTPAGPLIATQAGTTGLTPNLAAGLSVLFGIIGGIIFILVEKRDQFVRFWAMQSLFFGGAIFVLSIAVSILLGILGHISSFLVIIFSLLNFVVWLGIFVVWVIMLIQSFGGKEWELPVLGKMARQQLAKTPLL